MKVIRGETRRMNIETLPVLLMNYQWSREQKWNLPKDPNCDICLKTKITRASCRRRAGTVVPRADNFGDLTTADHKVLSERSESHNNHRYAVVVQDLATQCLQSYPCKTKDSQETQKNLMKFLEPTRRKPEVIHADNSLELFQLHLLRKEFQPDQLPQIDGAEYAGTRRRGEHVAKSKPMVMNLSSTFSASSSSAKDPIASKSPEILRVPGKPDAREI